MNRIRGAIVLGLAVLAVFTAGSRAAWAQETTGRVTGRVTDADTGAAIGGVTVIAQGPQGEDATVSDDTGHYQFTNLAVGTYVIRFYVANTSAQVEQPGVIVSAEKTVRVNAKIPSAAQAAAQQTYVITGKAPSVDVGSARVGMTFEQEYTLNLALNPNYGDVIAKAPGAFVDGSGNVSIGGSTGLENIYIVNGMNVTGLRFGNLQPSGQTSLPGGTNLPTEFLTQIDVSSGGYNAEYGGAMGGVINTVLKSGSNQFHGSVFTSWSPYWLSASPTTVRVYGSTLAGARRPDYDDRIGFEVGGPLIKDKLFFWAGLAPQLTNTHAFRYTYAFQDDGMGMQKKDANGTLLSTFLPDDTQRANETHRTYSYAATINYIPKPDHKLELSLFGTPSFNNQVRDGGFNAAFPGPTGNGPTTWAQESLTRANTDLSAHWTSKLFDRHWQVEAIGGMHSEYFNDRSPSAALNGLNQVQYHGSDLWALERLPGCEPGVNGFTPCPVNPAYSTGGFGEITKSTGYRWTGEVKSTHLIDLAGRNELKYGWHLDLSTLDITRAYSGGPGTHQLIQFFPDGMGGQTIQTQNFYSLKKGEYPTDFGADPTMFRYPYSDLINPAAGNYKDQLHASVKSLSDAFFLQDSYSPAALRNLTVSAGLRYELQTLYDMNGASFLDSRNLAPRLGVVYDPFNDGRTKVSANYGQFYESIPVDIAARYFGGENFAARPNIPPSTCSSTNPYKCTLPDPGSFMGDAASGYAPPVGNAALPQTHIQGQYHNEIVATLEREIMEDMTLRLDYQHRWLGRVIEDGYGDTSFQDVLANPGSVPKEALTDAKNAADQAAMDAKAASMKAMANPADKDLASAAANAQSAASSAASKYTILQTLAGAPKPERTYDALSLTLSKRFSKNWFARASYTYSRLVGNYEGLYQAEANYVAPNGTNAYDVPELYVNNRGYLPNDRPHQAKVDGFYSHPVGPGKITVGLSFLARSGMPRNYMSDLFFDQSQQIVFLLPRGAGGRTPATTQFDGHIAYSQQLKKDVTLEAYVDLFNIFDQRATQQTDDNYTYDGAAPIPNGTTKDLAYAKNLGGSPLNKNANYGHPISYQAPFYSRLGLRLMF